MQVPTQTKKAVFFKKRLLFGLIQKEYPQIPTWGYWGNRGFGVILALLRSVWRYYGVFI